MSFNIKQLAIASTSTMPVKDPKGSPVVVGGQELSITISGPGTRKFQSAKHAHDEAANQINMQRLKGNKAPEGESEKLLATFLATITESFNGFDYEGRNGFEAYKAAYMDPTLDLSEQVNKWAGDRGNFYVGSPTNSSSSSDMQPG